MVVIFKVDIISHYIFGTALGGVTIAQNTFASQLGVEVTFPQPESTMRGRDFTEQKTSVDT